MTLSDIQLLLPAFLAGSLVMLSHASLGLEVVSRGIIFIDLAIAQIAGVGVIAARMLDIESIWLTQLFAGTAAVAGAFLLTATERRLKAYQEPLIGVLFVLAACGGLLMLAKDPHGGEALKELLSGQILWITYDHLIFSSPLLIGAFLVWQLARERFQGKGFYLIFAVAITTSVQLVGVYLVFASLIIPALAVISWRTSRCLFATLLGITGYGLGLIGSLKLDLPASPLIVWALAALAVLFALAAKRKETISGP